MMKLTEHFCLEEFERSEVAESCGIVNKVPKEYIPHLVALCENVLEPLRAHAEDEPIVISSGYRCKALNEKVGGVKNSSHLFGEAADIHLPSVKKGLEWFCWMKDNLQFNELIWEVSGKSRWIHVSYREGGNKNRVVCGLKKVRS